VAMVREPGRRRRMRRERERGAGRARVRLRKISQSPNFRAEMDRNREPKNGPERAGLGKPSMLSGTEFAGIGLQMAMTIVVFMFGGIWLDDHLHTSPWFVLMCTFAGAFGGIYSIYRRVMAAQRRNDGDAQ